MATPVVTKTLDNLSTRNKPLPITSADILAMMANWKSIARKQSIKRVVAYLAIAIVCVSIFLWAFILSEQPNGIGIVLIIVTLVIGTIVEGRYRARVSTAQITFLIQLLPKLVRELAPNAKIILQTNIAGVDPVDSTRPPLHFMTFCAPLAQDKELGITLHFSKRRKGQRKFKGYKQKTRLKIWLTDINEQAASKDNLRALIQDVVVTVNNASKLAFDVPELFAGLDIAAQNRLLVLKAKNLSIARTYRFLPDDGYSAEQIMLLLRGMTQVAWP
ncbi:MAG: hypothetical protein HY080_10510 [Gammaproteobacteria bacterium]|nr:hypothetical protein [Gammaproteobacteria bacterium]